MNLKGRIVRVDFKYNDNFSVEGYLNSSVGEGLISDDGCNEFNIDLFWHGIPSNIKSKLTEIYANVAQQLESNGMLIDEKVFTSEIGVITLINPEYYSPRDFRKRCNEVEIVSSSKYFQLMVNDITFPIKYQDMNLTDLFDKMDKTLNSN